MGGVSFAGEGGTKNLERAYLADVQELPAGIRSVLRDREPSGHVEKVELNSSKEVGVDMMRYV